jgi:hypothetical protein
MSLGNYQTVVFSDRKTIIDNISKIALKNDSAPIHIAEETRH